MNATVEEIRIPGIHLEEELGRGAYSVVYRGRRGAQACAVKVPRWTGRWTRMVYREAVALARVRDPGLPAVLEVGEASGFPYLVMELARGSTLAERLARGRIAEREALRLGVQLASILEAVHGAGLVHRDVKPRNIILEENGRVRLVDFGFATPIEHGAVANDVAGTRAYAAPEQLRFPARVDGRADLYALGCVLFECLTGGLVHSLAGDDAVRDALATSGVRESAARVVASLCARDVAARYPDARSTALDLERVVTGLVPVGPVPGARPASRSAFVGRSGELARLESLLDGASRGRGSAVVVLGGRGAGKSRLLAELGDPYRKKREIRVVEIRCHEDEPPLGSILRFMEDVLRMDGIESAGAVEGQKQLRTLVAAGSREPLALARLLSPVVAELVGHRAEGSLAGAHGAGLDALAETIARLLRKAGPTLVALDDFHHVDPASREVWHRLARRASELEALLVFACRDGAPAAQLLSSSGTEEVACVDLPTLSEAEVASIVSRHLGTRVADAALTRRIASLCGGTPLGVLEVLGTFLDEGAVRPHSGHWQFDLARADSVVLPTSSLVLLGRRLRELPAATRTVLHHAAIVGSEFSDELLARAVGLDLAELDFALSDAERLGILEPAGARGHRFVHDSLREALVTELGPEERAALHQVVAEALDEPSPSGANGLRVGVERLYLTASHYAAGQLDRHPRRTHQVALAAAEAALALFDNETALRFYEVAEVAAAKAGIPLDLGFHRDVGEARLRIGALDDSQAAFHRALPLARSAQERARLWGRIAWVHHACSDEPRAREALGRAFEALGEHMPSDDLRSAGQTVAAIARSELGRVLERATGAVDKERLSLVCDLLYQHARLALEHNRAGAFLQSTLRGLELSRALGPSRAQASSEALIGVTLATMGSGAQGSRRLLRAQEMAEALGDPATVGFCVQLRAVVAMWAGDWDQGLVLLNQWLIRYDHWTEVNEFCLGVLNADFIESLRGRPRECWAWLSRALVKVRESGRVPAAFSAILSHRLRAALAALGRDSELSSLLAALPGRATLTVHREGFYRTLAWGPRARFHVETNTFGAEFEALVAEFEAEGLRPRTVHPMVFEYYMAVAHARIQQCLAAGPGGRAAAVTKLRSAVEDLRASAKLPLFKAHLKLAEAYLAYFQNDARNARRLFSEADGLGAEESSPWVQYGVARGLAHLLRAEGKSAAARDKARVAEALAVEHGAGHRAACVRQEFGLPVPAEAGSTRSARSSDSSRRRSGQLSSLLEVVRARTLEAGMERQATRVLDDVRRDLRAERGAMLFRVDQPSPAEILVVSGRFLETPEEAEQRNALLRALANGEDGKAEEALAAPSGGDRIAAAALRTDDRACGAIFLGRSETTAGFEPEERARLEALASDAAAALELARLLEEHGKVSETLRQAQRMEAVGNLAKGVAHDLDRILARIDESVEALRARAWVEGAELAELGAIAQASLRIGRLTRELMTLSGPRQTPASLCDANAILTELKPALHQLVGAHVEVAVDLAALDAMVRVDAPSLEQAFVNLVLNARDRMSRRGTLRLWTRNVDASDSPTLGNGAAVAYLVVGASDTGPALTPELVGPVFEPYASGEGNGGIRLRLASVYAFVKNVGGRVEVESSGEVGATFRMHLPLATAARST